jgi:AcrR family transcriptional regulator
VSTETGEILWARHKWRYRRFACRDDLIAACFERRLAEYAQAAEDALRAPDGWTGFCKYVERVCQMQAVHRGLEDVLTRTFPNAEMLEAHRTRGLELFLELIERAKTDGRLRADFVPEDLVLLLMGDAGVVAGAGDAAPDAWRRYVGLMLDGLRTEGATPLPTPPSPHQMLRAMRRLSPSPRPTRSAR